MGFEFGKEEVRTDDGREEVIRRVEYEKVMGTNSVVGYGRRWRVEMEQLGEDHFFYEEPAVDYKLRVSVILWRCTRLVIGVGVDSVQRRSSPWAMGMGKVKSQIFKSFNPMANSSTDRQSTRQFGGKKSAIEIDLSIFWREETGNRNRLVNLADVTSTSTSRNDSNQLYNNRSSAGSDIK
jgi:hypothetical protein